MATKPLNGSITPVNTVAGGVTKGWTPANYVGIDTTTARIVIDNTTQAVAVGVLRTPGILTITNGNGTFAFDGATDVDILDSLKNLTLTVSGQSYIYNGWTDTNIDFDIIFTICLLHFGHKISVDLSPFSGADLAISLD